MSLAGVIAFGGGSGRAEVSAILSRLKYSPDSEDTARILQQGAATFGVVNSGDFWAGSGATQGLLTIFNGVLFDRMELARKLGAGPLAPDMPAERNDAALAALAYRKWGDGFADELDGEYALALWDDARKRLLLARDAVARRGLVYARVGSHLIFASEAQALSGWPGLDWAIDEETVARTLSLQFAPGRTLFRGVRAVRGGHVLVAEDGKPDREIRYWRPLDRPQLHLKDWREYAAALREAMVRAVERRLPEQGLIASQLSSGFDSSSVTALAAQALLKQNRPLVAYTAVPVHRVDAGERHAKRFADEWPLASTVAAMYPNIEHVAIANDAADWMVSLDTLSDAFEAAPAFIRNARWYYAIYRDAQARGVATMLEGQAGNLTGSYDAGFGLYDLRRRGRWLEFASAVRRRRRQGQKWPSLISAAWAPPPKVKAIVQRLRGQRMKKLYEVTVMRPEFYAATGLPVKKLSGMGGLIEGDRRNGAAWRLSILEMADLGAVPEGMRRAFGIARHDPTADRRLVELCLSIPDEMFAPLGIRRELYREAMRQDLPAALLAEPLRGLQSSDFLEMFGEWLPEWRAELDRLEQSPFAAAFLDLRRMRAMLDAWPGDVSGGKQAADLAYNYTFGGALALGRYLRRVQERE